MLDEVFADNTSSSYGVPLVDANLRFWAGTLHSNSVAAFLAGLRSELLSCWLYCEPLDWEGTVHSSCDGACTCSPSPFVFFKHLFADKNLSGFIVKSSENDIVKTYTNSKIYFILINKYMFIKLVINNYFYHLIRISFKFNLIFHKTTTKYFHQLIYHYICLQSILLKYIKN